MTKVEKWFVQQYGIAFVASLRAQIPSADYTSKKESIYKFEWEKACFNILGKDRYNASRAERYKTHIYELMIEMEGEKNAQGREMEA